MAAVAHKKPREAAKRPKPSSLPEVPPPPPPVPPTEKQLRAVAKKERMDRLAALAAKPGALRDRLKKIEQTIDAAQVSSRAELRRRLYEAADRSCLPLGRGKVAHTRSFKETGVLEWLEAVTLASQQGDDLQAAWLSLIDLYADQPADRVSERLGTARTTIKNEWARRQRSPEKPLGFFVWPSTAATVGDASLGSIGAPKRGMLAALGYHVGVTKGLPAPVRQFLLDEMFAMHLPLVHSQSYTREWDDPSTPGRLRKMADTIASLVRNAKRRSHGAQTRMQFEWEDDLNYLYRSYYLGLFSFGWPDPDADGV
jgi:hypothetical protein